MTITQIPNISYEIKDDVIYLEQDDVSGNLHRIALHRLHLYHISSKLSIPSLTITAKTIGRRLEMVEARINALADSEHYRKEIIERCGSGLEFITELDAVCDIASEFIKDMYTTTDTRGQV